MTAKEGIMTRVERAASANKSYTFNLVTHVKDRSLLNAPESQEII